MAKVASSVRCPQVLKSVNEAELRFSHPFKLVITDYATKLFKVMFPDSC